MSKPDASTLPHLVTLGLGHVSVDVPRPPRHLCFGPFPADRRSVIVQVKPGLSGLGPSVFRGEEDILADHGSSEAFYDNVIAPYKGQVEAWYVNHRTLGTYFKVIGVTAWVVLFPASGIVWRVFEGLPVPPVVLRGALTFPVHAQ